MTELIATKGPNAGQRYPLEPGGTLIGRQPGVAVYLDSLSVSRHHARVFCEDGAYFIEDLGSSNGTYLNGARRLTGRILLTEHDELRIGPYTFQLLGDGPPPSNQTPWDMQVSGPHQSDWPGVWVNMDYTVVPPRDHEASDEELIVLVTQLSERVEHSHVCVRLLGPLANQLRQRLLDPGSEERQLLRTRFRQVIILDAAAGLDEAETFVADRFLEYSVRQFITAFGLELSHEWHSEDLFQILKDESRSLICFVNARRFPTVGMERLRGFTQTVHHQCLMLL